MIDLADQPCRSAGDFYCHYVWQNAAYHGASIEFARTISVNALLMVELFYLFNCRFLTQSIFSRDFFRRQSAGLMACVGVVLLQLAFTYFPPSQRVFALQSIAIADWLTIIFSTLLRFRPLLLAR